MALKLTDSDKKTIVELYQHPEESTATLASRYAVSSSTISRILKQALSPTEYQNIVQQKKGGGSKPQNRKSSAKSTPSKASSRSSKSSKSSSPAKPKLKSSVVSEESAAVDSAESTSESKKTKASPDKSKSVSSRGRKRQRSATKGKTKPTSQTPNTPEDDLDVVQLTTTDIAPAPKLKGEEQQASEEDADNNLSPVEMGIDSPSDELVHEIQSDLLDEEFDDDIDDDEVDELDDDIDDDDDDDMDAALELPLDGDHLSILPFSEAQLPRTCYIIIDRSAELITRPLKTFADLGTVPDTEINEPTLPIFDNHRVAKRFANRRTQRIVKVPDARVLRKTSPYLMDKGITRLLLDGQVYALIDEDLD